MKITRRQLRRLIRETAEDGGEIIDLGREKIKRDPTHPMNIKSRRLGIVRSEPYGGVQEMVMEHTFYASIREVLIGVLEKGLDPKFAPYTIVEM